MRIIIILVMSTLFLGIGALSFADSSGSKGERADSLKSVGVDSDSHQDQAEREEAVLPAPPNIDQGWLAWLAHNATFIVTISFFILVVILLMAVLQRLSTVLAGQERGLSAIGQIKQFIDTRIPAIERSVASIERLESTVADLCAGMTNPPPNESTSSMRPPTDASAMVAAIPPAKPGGQLVLYFPVPDKSGSFTIQSGRHEFQPGGSVYRLSPNQDGSIASFEILDDDEVNKKAIASPSSYLDPVCDIRNRGFVAPRRIRTISPGKAVKTGDRWVVSTLDKAKIEYE